MKENVALKYWASPLKDHLPAGIKRDMPASLYQHGHIWVDTYARLMRDWGLV